MSDRPDAAELLRAAARAHRPDRERMLARVERGIRGTGAAGGAGRSAQASLGRGLDRLRGKARVVGAAAALTVTVGVASAAVAWTADQPSEPTARPADPPAQTGAGGAGGTGGPAAPDAEVRTSAELDPGSNPYWSQSNVTVRTSAPLTAFTLELRIAATGGVAATGAWRTLPSDDFELDVAAEGGALVFRWTLRQGAEIPPGEHVFAGQYDHGEGRRIGDDFYRVTGRSASGPVSARGDFESR
ncbi:hypothetical protein [Streptomyces sp. B6B3]|uniref:hypothetical protein n=1 Tax=Streptomyces sp. B6B3 TaxID=3153570 RepID=UPI00325D2926